mgnify:CR=1 FL=1
MPLLPPDLSGTGIAPSSADSQAGQPETSPGGDAVSNLDKWVVFLCQAEIPVLRGSVDELARLKIESLPEQCVCEILRERVNSTEYSVWNTRY